MKTDLLFFTKGQPTERVWYYDMTLKDDFRPRKVNKSNLRVFGDLSDFFERLSLPPDAPERVSERSWYVRIEDIRAKSYDVKATNPNAPDLSDKRTVTELTTIINESQNEINRGLDSLKKKLGARA